MKLAVEPAQIVEAPAIAAVGKGLTVTTAVLEQPLLLTYVIVDVPAETPVTKPVFETVATAVLEDVQGFVAFAVGEPVNCVVDPAHTVNVPVIFGSGLIVTTPVL